MSKRLQNFHLSAPGSRIIVALDFEKQVQVLALVDQLNPSLCRLKVGKELFVRTGPALVRKLVDRGFDVFLDLKFHDIPNTVAAACRAAADLGVWMVNVHASGGGRMMRAAHAALDSYATDRPLLLAVTVLTSMEQPDLQEVGVKVSPQKQVLHLAQLAGECGLDGVVCSANEAQILRKTMGFNFCLVTPGIRPNGMPADDQRRVMTPREAVKAGADYLVMGRPITQAAQPLQVLRDLQTELA